MAGRYTTANWNVLTHGASAGPPEYGALLATPPGYGIVDGDEIPYLPAAAEQQRLNYENRFQDDPELKCFLPGVPRPRITCPTRSRFSIRQITYSSRISSRAPRAS